MLAAGRKRETAQLGPKTSYLSSPQCISSHPFLGYNCRQRLSFQGKNQTKTNTQPGSPLPKTAQVWHSRLGQGQNLMSDGGTTHPRRREIRATESVVSCRLCDNAPSTLTTHLSKAQADWLPTPPAEEASCQRKRTRSLATGAGQGR